MGAGEAGSAGSLLQGQAVKAWSSGDPQLAFQWCELSAPSKALGATLCMPHCEALSDWHLCTPDLACPK